MRVVSLLPSATEMLCQLGLRDSLVAVSHECDFPAGIDSLPKVTRPLVPVNATSAEIDDAVRERVGRGQALYSLDHDAIRQLAPDVVVTQTLCNVCAVAEEDVEQAFCGLPSRPQLVTLEPTRLADVLNAMVDLGRVVDAERQAVEAVGLLRQRIEAVESRSQRMGAHPRVVFLEWIDPPFAAGHWTPELVELAGGRCEIGEAGERSFVTSWESVVASDPEVLVFSCCGFAVERTLADIELRRSAPEWASMTCVKSGRVYAIDGSAYFNRPGPRLVDSLEILANAIDPKLHPLPKNLAPATQIG